MQRPLHALQTIFAFQRDALKLFAASGVYERGVAEIDFGLRPGLVVGDPALAIAILTSPVFAKGHLAYGPLGTFAGFGALRGLVGPSLPVLDGEEGLARRRLLAPVYHGVVARFEAAVSSAPYTFPACGGEEIDLYALLSAAVFDRFSRVMFGRPYPALAGIVEEAVSTATTALDPLSKSFLPYAAVWSPPGLRLQRCRRALLGVAAEVDADLQRALERDPEAASRAAITPLLRAGLTEAQRRDEILTQIVAGTETTTITAAWALVLLVRHPEILARAREDRALVARVINEALRLYPAFWTMIRVPEEDATLEGRAIPRGTVCFVSPFCVHRNPSVWPEPLRFWPDRALAHPPSRGAFMPYGYGPRACVGARLAQSILQEIVYEAVTQLDLRFVAGEPEGPEEDPLIVVLKSRTGFRMEARSRAPAAPSPSGATRPPAHASG